MWDFLLGVFFGSGIVAWISALSIDSPRIQKKIKEAYKKINPPQGYISGLSSEEQDYQDSLKSSFGDKKID